MDLRSALALKDEILARPRQEAEQRATQVQNIVEPLRERRVAVGYSQLQGNDYRVEIRVERGDGAAYGEAADLQRRHGDREVNVEVIPTLEIPSTPQLRGKAMGKRSLTRVRRPLSLGASIGLVGGGAGSLGAFVSYRPPISGSGRKRRIPQHQGILSNNHVLALVDRAEFGDLVYQPGFPHQKPILGETKVAKLSRTVAIARNTSNNFDAAVAELLAGVNHDGNVIPDHFPYQRQRLEREQDWNVLQPGQKVCKIGCRTGFTRGTVSAVAVDGLTVSVGRNFLAVFDNVLEVRWESNRKPFTRPGDSGSLVFTEDGLIPIGLHFAGGRIQKSGRSWIGVSYACSLKGILTAFDARLA